MTIETFFRAFPIVLKKISADLVCLSVCPYFTGNVKNAAKKLKTNCQELVRLKDVKFLMVELAINTFNAEVKSLKAAGGTAEMVPELERIFG